jgi:hypothetical protein
MVIAIESTPSHTDRWISKRAPSTTLSRQNANDAEHDESADCDHAKSDD